MKKTPLMITLLALFIIAIAATSCKKDDAPGTPAPSTNARKIKYEITGPYINKLLLAFTEISGGLESVTTALPWTKEITYSSSVGGIGIGGNSQIPAVSSDAGKVITIKIYSGGKLVKTSTATADANGIINFPTITYIF
jgi:hypothetical protein